MSYFRNASQVNRAAVRAADRRRVIFRQTQMLRDGRPLKPEARNREATTAKGGPDGST